MKCISLSNRTEKNVQTDIYTFVLNVITLNLRTLTLQEKWAHPLHNTGLCNSNLLSTLVHDLTRTGLKEDVTEVEKDMIIGDRNTG